MKAFEKFYISPASFNAATCIASFHFHFDHDVYFTETIDFSGIRGYSTPDTTTMAMLLFHASIAIGISYYKLYPTQDIVVEDGVLDQQQKEFWQTFYIQGLGEFFYTNNLDPKGLANFVSLSHHSHPKSDFIVEDTYLVPIGGGKDSCVTIELLKKQGEDITLYTNGRDYPLHQDIQNISGLERILTERTIDPLLIDMNNQGYYNGHVPITGIISFLTLIVSYLGKHQHIAFSNERSANFGNTLRKGLEINHQWSKSYDFEISFQTYVHSYVHENIVYSSMLRKRYELRIAKEFSTYDHYFPIFSSCNRNFHLDKDAGKRRCNICPKCLFTYMIMRPFITEKQVYAIWGQELYDEPNNTDLFKELRGIAGIKPFECVGTYDEAQYSTWLYIRSLKKEELGRSPLLTWFATHITPSKKQHEREALGQELLQTYT